MEIQAIEITTNEIGDALVLPDLLAQISSNERIATVSADGAYDTRKCHAAIAERHAQAVIPVRRNGRPSKKDGPGVDARNEALRAIKRLGRKSWKVERLPSTQPGRDQNASLQTARFARGIPHP